MAQGRMKKIISIQDQETVARPELYVRENENIIAKTNPGY